MGERKGQNKYYPPDFDPAKHYNLDKYHGSHPLRERARKLSQGILIIRFEMPYNIWCDGCNNPVGMGVRYNAEKSKVGNYYSTPIYKFRMKCHLCNNHYEIKTDPQNHDYVIISGARRKEQRWDPAENEQVVTEDKNDIKKRATDAMYKLEHGEDDKDKIKAAKPALGKLQRVQQRSRDDYLLNKLARSKFRNEKKSLKITADIDKALLEKSSLDIKLAWENEEDVRLASLLRYNSTQSFAEKQKQKREAIESRPLFISDASTTTTNKPPSQYNNIIDVKKNNNLLINTKLPNPFQVNSSTPRKEAKHFGIVRNKKTSSCDRHAEKETKEMDKHNSSCVGKIQHLREQQHKESLSEGKMQCSRTSHTNIESVLAGSQTTNGVNALHSLLSVYGESDDNSGNSS